MGLLKKFGVLKSKSVTDQKSLDHWIKPSQLPMNSQINTGLDNDPPVDPPMIHDPNPLDQARPIAREEIWCQVGAYWQTSPFGTPVSAGDDVEELIDSFLNWVSHCRPGEEWEIPNAWLAESDELCASADIEVRKQNPELRVWREGKDKLACKVFFGPELPPSRKSQNRNRFRSSKTKRIETMWCEELGWCRWNDRGQDYFPDPSLNEDPS